MSEPSWERSFNGSYVELQCRCGWTGLDTEIEDWAVQRDRDRVVRQCPDCEEPVPEWGALQPIEGAAKIACGPLETALSESDADIE